MKNEAILEAPWSLDDGTSMTVSELSDADHQALDAWVRGAAINAARMSIPEDASQAEFDRVLGAAMRESLQFVWTQPPGSTTLRTLEGMSQLAWRSVRKKHPDATLASVRRLLRKVENIVAFRIAYAAANGFVAEKLIEKTEDTKSPT